MRIKSAIMLIISAGIISYGAESDTIRVTDKSYFRSFFKKEAIQEIEKKSDNSKMNTTEAPKEAVQPQPEVKKEEKKTDNPFVLPEVKKEVAQPVVVNAPVVIRPKLTFNVSMAKLNESIKNLRMYITKKNNIIRIDTINKEDKLEYLYGKDDMVLLLNNTEVKSNINKSSIYSVIRNGLLLRVKNDKGYIKAKSGIKMRLFVKEFQDGIY